ncbi:MAG: hypothetical protein BWY75_03558 [bacterium ADurb.Bin425]|nr:MAG: hypothetical protein BWY75_03558 [bacterium ADurb.Bin425]
MAKVTESPRGTNKERLGSVRKKSGTKTIQIERVETRAGKATCLAPSKMAVSMSFPIAILRCTFSTSTVASSTSMPTASAKPPRVIELIVCPVMLRPITAAKIASGIEVATIRVERQLPSRASIITAVRRAAVRASLTTSLTHSRTKRDWSVITSIWHSFGTIDFSLGKTSFTPCTTLRVEASPLLRILKRTALLPFRLTILS